MNNFRFIFFRLCLYLILGILFGFYVPTGNFISLLLTGLSLAIFLIAYFIARKQLFYGSFPGIATFLLIFNLGYGIAHFSQPEFQPNHYLKFEGKAEKLLKAHITEELKPTAYAQRFILEADEVISKDSAWRTQGRILLNLYDTLAKNQLSPGKEIVIPFEPKEIKPPTNPFQFSYKDYLKNLKIERQLNVSSEQIKILESEAPSLNHAAKNLRREIIKQLKRENFSSEEMAIFQALILGDRRDLSDDLYKDYAAAGAIHILAISGLHIGILLWLLNFLLKPLDRFRKGKIIKTILIICLLWSFALLTGLSASVVRAVSMFSFIAVGMQLNRKTSTLNSIFVSLFFLLIFNPYYLFQAGFQLSYLAVTGIVLFYPLLYPLITIRRKWLDYFWKLIVVSLCAQIAILPVALFYFHQFPGLFLLTNLVVLPFLAIILGFGILIILLSGFDILPAFLAEAFGFLLSLMNSFVKTIAGVESFVLTDLKFSGFQLAAYFLILFALFLFYWKKSFRNILFLIASILAFQMLSIAEILKIPSEEFIVFQKNRTSEIAWKQNNFLSLYGTEKPKDYLRERKIKEYEFEEIPSILKVSDTKILIVDSSGVYQIPEFSPEIVLLKDSPKINLERLISMLRPERIVADGSNFPKYIRKWRETCNKKEIPFHYTGEKGAFVLSGN